MRKIITNTLSTFLLVLAFSCSSNDSITEEEQQQSNQTFFAKVNGNSFSTNNDSIEAGYTSTSNTDGFSIVAIRTDGFFGGEAIFISLIESKENAELETGQVYTNNDQNIALFGGYVASVIEDDFNLDGTETMSIELTKIDKGNMLISGKFSFVSTIENDDDSKTTYTVTDGVFNDVNYKEN